MNINEIKDLLLTIDQTNLTYVKLQNGDFKIETSKENTIITNESSSEVVDNKEITCKPESVTTYEENIHIIKAPLMGTFYESSTPDSKSFVSVGDKINNQSVLCIIEAMKLMNEITSDVDGEIIEVLVKNEDLVEYNQPLFKIKID